MNEDKARALAKRFGVRMCDENGDTYDAELYCLGVDDIMEMAKALAQPEQDEKAFNDGVLEGVMRERAYWLKAQPEQEPVAWHYQSRLGNSYVTEKRAEHDKDWRETPLYTTPPQRKPLTDEEISNLWCEVSNTDFVTADTHEFARAIEAAHGIKE